MIKIISKNEKRCLQKPMLADLQTTHVADMKALYNKGFRCLQELFAMFADCRVATIRNVIYYKGYRVLRCLHTECIYYIYRSSQYLTPIMEKEKKLQTTTCQKNIYEEAFNLASNNHQLVKNNKTILSLDLGNTMGWAMRDGSSSSNQISSGRVKFKTCRFEGSGMVYLRFRRWLTDIKNRSMTGTIDAVYFEEVRRHLGTAAAHSYGGFMAHLTAWCEHHEIPYQSVPVKTIKKHITGKGNASKQEVIAAIREKGFNPADDNEADSLALLDYVLNVECGVIEL